MTRVPEWLLLIVFGALAAEVWAIFLVGRLLDRADRRQAEAERWSRQVAEAEDQCQAGQVVAPTTRDTGGSRPADR